MRFLLFILIVCIACNNNDEAAADSGSVHANASDTFTTSASPVILTGCYQMTLKKDSALLDITIKDTTVSGKLNYIFYGKDHNLGTIQGVLRNDIIYADYTFESEGVTSVREVIFKVEDDTLVPAYGDLTEKDKKIVFVNKDDVEFNDLHPFIKVACTQ